MISIGVGYLVYLLALMFGAFSGWYSPKFRYGAEMLQTYHLFALFFPVMGLLFLLKKPRSFWLYVVLPILLSFLVSFYVAWMSPENILGGLRSRHVWDYLSMLVLPYLFFGFVLVSIAAYVAEFVCGLFLFKAKGNVDVWQEVKQDFRSPVLWIFVLIMIGITLKI